MSAPPTKLTELYSLARVMSPAGNHMAPPLGIFDITLVTGNNVNMCMENALLSCRTHVHTDVVAIARILPSRSSQ